MSAETKFTPGPWKCDKPPVFGEWYVRQDPADWNGMGYQLICSLPADKKGTHYGDMFKANAYLIAAAPTMYETLLEARKAVKLLGDLTACRADDDYVDGISANIEAALKKARGE